MAPPDHHMLLEPLGIRLTCGPKENHTRPAIDPLFRAAAPHSSEDATSLIRLVIQGGRGPLTPTGPAPQMMPGFAGTLTDVEMARVLTHVRQAWGNDAKPVTAGDVTKLRAAIAR